MKIFKFRDLEEGDYAFVAHETVEQAKALLEENTALPLTLIGSAKYDEFPACMEKLDNKPGIWINNILPF